MTYNISAMVIYSEQIEAKNKEEAINKFKAYCPYDIDGNSIECEEDEESEEDEE